MHRFLTAFFCLSTLALTQNVVAGTPSAHASLQTSAIVEAGAAIALAELEAELEPVRAAVGGEVPSPGTMLLLVTGLAGLSAVGSPKRDVRRPAGF